MKVDGILQETLAYANLEVGTEEKTYTYTVITTDSNKQLNFLHDRMPVILENGSEELRTWLDPKKTTWSKELQSLLVPFKGEVEVYPVSKEVGKVGNNSPNFIIPVGSSENKANIANFFAKGNTKSTSTKLESPETVKSDSTTKEIPAQVKHEQGEDRKTVDHDGKEDNAPLPVPKSEGKKGIKRELEDLEDDKPPAKVSKISDSPNQNIPPSKPAPKTRSATSNKKASPKKPASKEKGSQKITSFFGK
jgi:hypothetical protein